MADPVAIVETIVKLGLQIKDAVDTVRYNEEECQEIKKHVLRISDILSHLQQSGMISPAMRGALVDLEESVQHALELVTACQEASTIRRHIMAGGLSKQLRRVKEDISSKVQVATFAVITHTITAGLHPHLPSQQPEVQLFST